MSCLLLLQFFERNVDKHIGIPTMFSEFGRVSQENVFRGSFGSIIQLQLIFMSALWGFFNSINITL